MKSLNMQGPYILDTETIKAKVTKSAVKPEGLCCYNGLEWLWNKGW